ncbi:AraC family transcriptional regulator [Denitromonas iodatirespirans]|uniref:Helix-turn-helix transcriptional regulator n=1 Tax=Denitromonas iodatirespirans TaxID=2795389 RepID=A0A944D979_DENI1|nr:helix-turn-helix transcriptional regulator [Denitromonas iodatirespirans]MBT0962294.1 helix-turn-helix transcriptional regulator [Denitromonas iodatirespirans]
MSLNGQKPLPDARRLRDLKVLPRPLYGHVESLPNRVIGYRHRHPWGQFAYAAEGVLDVLADAGRFVAPPQRAVWIPAGVMHRVVCSAQTQVRSLYVAREMPGWAADRCRVLVVSPLLRELIRAFSAVPEAYDEAGPDGRLAAVLLDQIAAAPEVALMLPLPTDPRLRPLCARVQARPERHITLADWSARIGVSEKTLSRCFLRETGLTFRVWRQRMRLLGALPALAQGERVTDVALACGYESLSAFIAAFKALFDATPGEFLQRHRALQRDD